MPNGIFAALDTPYKPKYRVREATESRQRKFYLKWDKTDGQNLSTSEKEVLKALYDEGFSSVPSLLLRVDMTQTILEDALEQLLIKGLIEKTQLSGKKDGLIYNIKN